MQLAKRKKKPKADASLPLINIVFLLLLFFLVAGQVSEKLRDDIEPPLSTLLEKGQPPQKGVFISSTGDVFFNSIRISAIDVATMSRADAGATKARCLAKCPIRIIADHRLEAVTLTKLLKKIRQGGAKDLMLVTVKGTKQ